MTIIKVSIKGLWSIHMTILPPSKTVSQLSPQHLWNASSVHVCQLHIHFSCSVSCHWDKTAVFDLLNSVWFLDLQIHLEKLPYSLHLIRKSVSNTFCLQFSCFPFPNKSFIHLLTVPVYVIWGRHITFTPKWVASWSPNHVAESTTFLRCFALYHKPVPSALTGLSPHRISRFGHSGPVPLFIG